MSHIKKPAVTSAPVHELIGERWSPRAFAATPVAREAVVSILEAGRWAASTNNSQPWRWVVTTSEDPAAHAAAFECFAPGNQRWAKTAPVYIFALARKTFEANGNRYGRCRRPDGVAGGRAWACRSHGGRH
jgi:nitroreductase